MRYAVPKPILLGSHFYLRVRAPTDLVTSAKGTFVSVPVGREIVPSKVGDAVEERQRQLGYTMTKLTLHHALNFLK